jgi:hypothetical protein
MLPAATDAFAYAALDRDGHVMLPVAGEVYRHLTRAQVQIHFGEAGVAA